MLLQPETKAPFVAKKKIDLKGKSSGGSEHKSKKRPSTKRKHQKGRAAKRESYGGERGDVSRRYPRKKWKGYKGPWPPPEKADPEPGGEGEEAITRGGGENFGSKGEEE